METNRHSYRILGIDPGSLFMGYAVIGVVGMAVTVEDLGVLDVHKTEDFYQRLRLEQQFLKGYITQFHPTDLAIESQFVDKNPQSMIKIVRSQTIAIGVALENEMAITEYTPLKIKMAITHNGRAEKYQVADMLRRFLTLPEDFIMQRLDATDALAVAYCHFLQRSSPFHNQKSFKDWKSYAKSKGLI